MGLWQQLSVGLVRETRMATRTALAEHGQRLAFATTLRNLHNEHQDLVDSAIRYWEAEQDLHFFPPIKDMSPVFLSTGNSVIYRNVDMKPTCSAEMARKIAVCRFLFHRKPLLFLVLGQRTMLPASVHSLENLWCM